MSAAKYYERVAVLSVHSGELYIDSLGRVWRDYRQSNAGDGRLVAVTRHRIEQTVRHGYLRVSCGVGGKRIQVFAHRLVWQFFEGDIQDGLTINHKDGIKSNNRLGNLEAVSQGDNNRHAFRVIRTRSLEGENHSRRKLNNNSVIAIRAKRKEGFMLRVLAREFGVSEATISLVCSGKHWDHIRVGL